MSHGELPASAQASVARQHGPKIVTVLRTKWPDCAVEFLDGDELPPPSC